MHSRPPRVLGLAMAAMFVVGACGGNPASPGAATGGPATGNPATAAPGTAAPPTFAPADLRWYCCFGTGEDPAGPDRERGCRRLRGEVPRQHAQVRGRDVRLGPRDAVDPDRRRQRADIVGPAGVGGIAAFKGQWLDLDPLITKWGYDTSQFDPGAVALPQRRRGPVRPAVRHLPLDALVQERPLHRRRPQPPPHKYGEKYKMPDGTEVDWDYNTIREIAKILTVDANGNDATSAEFDPTKIEQYGFEVQRDDLRGLGAYFGAGNLTGPDGKTVTIPDAWKDGWKFFYDGMWKDHFIMTGRSTRPTSSTAAATRSSAGESRWPRTSSGPPTASPAPEPTGISAPSRRTTGRRRRPSTRTRSPS